MLICIYIYVFMSLLNFLHRLRNVWHQKFVAAFLKSHVQLQASPLSHIKQAQPHHVQ